ncbi:MAG: HD domain-containing phosphohydrolase [Halanaerobium sp.]|nr:HD domain-containing phosphohydrolase [Halanaerobium sp.]
MSLIYPDIPLDLDSLNRILNYLPEVAFFIDYDFSIKWANQKASEYFQQEPRKLMGKKCHQVGHGRKVPCENCVIEKAVITGKYQVGENDTPDGHTWLVHLYPMGDRGVLNISKNITDLKKRRFMEERLAAQLQEMKAMIDGTINALGKSVSARDPYTSGHQQQVAKLASEIGTRMGLPEARVNNLKLASLVHDIGKLKVPIEILTKPTRLSYLEYELIKSHPVTGYEILKDVNIPSKIADFVREHHERLDGSGYPDGLSEKEIHFESKILAVADVGEEMTSHRPYRPALGIDKALLEVEENKGRLYDSEVVDCCLAIFAEDNGFFGE